MINFFYNLNCYNQALIASLCTFLMTILGASVVLFFKKVNKTLMEIMLAISAGIMLAAAIFSLLLPSIEQAENLGLNVALVVTLSMLVGSLLLIFGDKFSGVLIKDENSKFKNVMLLVVSIVLHNIPEGLAIGCAFGSVIYGLDGATTAAAISLAVGIGIQNFPEGAAISVPLRKIGLSRKKSFIIGSLTGIVEPIASLIGVFMVLKVKIILPYLLAFAAGAMIFVIVEELIPEALSSKSKNLMAYLALVGFVIMMILEIGI